MLNRSNLDSSSLRGMLNCTSSRLVRFGYSIWNAYEDGVREKKREEERGEEERREKGSQWPAKADHGPSRPVVAHQGYWRPRQRYDGHHRRLHWPLFPSHPLPPSILSFFSFPILPLCYHFRVNLGLVQSSTRVYRSVPPASQHRIWFRVSKPWL